MKFPFLFLTVFCSAIFGTATTSHADLCLENTTTSKTFVLLKVSPKIGKAKGKAVAGYRVHAGFEIGPIHGTALTQSTGKTLMLTFLETQIEVDSSGNASWGADTTQHQIVFNDALGDNDQNWDVGETAIDCTRLDAGSGTSTVDCDTVTAVDCESVVMP